MSRETKSFAESRIDQENQAMKNMIKRNNRELLNMFENFLKNKILSEDIEKRKKEQEEKEIKKEKEKFEKRKKEEEKTQRLELEKQKEYKREKMQQAADLENQRKEEIQHEKEMKQKEKEEKERKMKKQKELDDKIQKHKQKSEEILENYRNKFIKNMSIKDKKVKENKEKQQIELKNKQEIKNIKKEEKFEKNIKNVEKERKEKIERIQKNSKLKLEKAEIYAQRIKDEQDYKKNIIRLEEKKQKKHIDEINRKRQEKVDEYYRNLREEEENPRPINKEKAKRIEEQKYRNIIKTERIKSANLSREKELKKRGEKIIDDLKKKDLITKRVFDEKKIIADLIREENEEKQMAFEWKHQQIEIEKENKINKMREELDDKKKRINDFLYEKELIAKEARYISDQMTFEKRRYFAQFDKMFYKRGLDHYAYMNVKDMIAGDPKYKEICQFYEGNEDIE